MSLKVYYNKLSPPSRAVLMTLRALDIEAQLVNVNILEGEQLSSEFIKLNPFHTVPTLEDTSTGFSIWDSHVINTYLVEKYAPGSVLYPKDPESRAIINQRLHFDSGILGSRMGSIIVSLLRNGAKTIAKDKADLVIQGYCLLESLLEENEYVAGPNVTVADLNIIATITSANILVPIAANRFPKIVKWIAKIEKLECYSENLEGLKAYTSMMRSKISH